MLPENIHWNLYGRGYEPDGRENISYLGAFVPEELPLHLDGSFGLVWDGPSVDTCSGIFGDYLSLNNPHKVSLYLASGLPVIIWEGAALASFIEKAGVGFTVSSLHEIRNMIDRLSDEEYEKMKLNAKQIGRKLKSGAYLRAAAAKAAGL